MANNESGVFFYLIGHEGARYVPRMTKARDGRYGYPVHPPGKGNDASAAEYTEDEKRVVQQVVLQGHGVRARVEGSDRDGQTNTVGLSGRSIRGYWLCPTKMDWVAGARFRPENEKVPA